MNEDLHDIDRLFRDGIEGHEEAVPPSVWEGVNNDLDKKQASYYKSKYYRLKRAAVILLLLCLFAGAYIVYTSSGGRKGVEKKTYASNNNNSGNRNNNPAQTVTAAPNKNSEQKENESPLVGDDEPNGVPPQGQKQANKTNDSVALTTDQTSGEKPSEKTENNPGESTGRPNKKTGTNKKIVAVNSAPNHQFRKESRNVDETIALLKKTKSAVIKMQNKPPVVSSQPTATTVDRILPINGKNYASPFIDPKALAANNRSILPQVTTASKSKTKTAHGFSLSAFVAPNLSFDRLEDNDRLASPGRDRQTARRMEQDNFSFSGGLLLAYNVSNKLSVQLGVSITSSSTTIAPTTVYAKPDGNGHTRYELHCSSGYSYITPKGSVQPTVSDSSAKASGTVSKLTYVTVPASVSYRIDAGRFSLYPSIGAGLNILANGKTKTSLSNNMGSESVSTSISGLKPTYVDGHIGFGIEYNLSKKMALGLRPNARIALTPINKETPVQSYQNFLSVETGVRIKL